MTLQELREDIEGTDAEIIRLIRARMDIALKIAEEKTSVGLPTHDPDRVDVVLARVANQAKQFNLDPNPVRDIFITLIRMSEDIQDQIRH